MMPAIRILVLLLVTGWTLGKALLALSHGRL
jgi:hypothetical protein